MYRHSNSGGMLRTAAAGVATALVAGTGLLLAGGTAAAATVATPTASTGAINFGAPTAPSAATTVPIERNKYLPADLTVTVGQKVTWTNKDSKPHTVTTTKAPVAFDSGLFKQGESWSYTFTKAGEYGYYCAVHPDMVAKVIVTEKAAKPAKAVKPSSEAPKPTQQDNAHPGMPGMSHSGSGKPGGAPAAPSYRAAGDPVSGATDPFMKHLEVAHFQRTPAGQVQDIAEFDTWVLSHQALFRQMLDYEVGKSSTLGTTPATDAFMQHMDAAHWNRSPMGQAEDAANFDSWNKSHLAMFRMMLDPAVGRSSTLGSSGGTGVFMQHMDAAHWNKSANEQAADIADDPSGWTSSHGAMFQAMLASFGSGHTPGQ